MSEWFDNQKKSNGNFRKFLQERLDKTNPRRTFTADVLRKVREAVDLGELDALIEQQALFGRRVTQKNK